ncbi:MAG TPA: hypothetical protein EYP49_09905 [Anaerolineae bacterium]|nr:hypothetical protein [Anaerolineae bacterium]
MKGPSGNQERTTLGSKVFSVLRVENALLYLAPGLLEWLEKVSGESPREWLDQVAVLVEHYAVHYIFTQVWGDAISWVFAPAGGGETALRISITQACWLGQEITRPFPIPYVPPFLSWGHFHPSLEDHLVAIARAGANSLFLALAHRPHWFFRLDKKGRRRVYEALVWNLPAALSVHLERLERCRQARDVSALREALDPTFVIPDPPGANELLRWCDELDRTPDVVSPPSPLERWKRMQELLLEVLSPHSLSFSLQYPQSGSKVSYPAGAFDWYQAESKALLFA